MKPSRLLALISFFLSATTETAARTGHSAVIHVDLLALLFFILAIGLWRKNARALKWFRRTLWFLFVILAAILFFTLSGFDFRFRVFHSANGIIAVLVLLLIACGALIYATETGKVLADFGLAGND
ncbi:MAG TPA: hypothetical protein VFU15_06935 [Bacteroidia bacterium]|nr:hypothetical protein [Bacteroidia bacterium]